MNTKHFKVLGFEYASVGDVTAFTLFKRLLYLRIGSMRRFFPFIVREDRELFKCR